MQQTHHIMSDLSSWSSREVHQANERVLRTSNKIAQKTSSFYFTYYIITTICKRNISLRDKVFHNYSYFLRESTKSSSPTTGIKILWVVQLESMPGYKYPNIDSGATPIGSAGCAPDRKSILREGIRQEGKKKKFWAYDRLQVPDHSLRGYSHRERWSRTRWRFTSRSSSMKSGEENFESIVGGKHQKINSTFHSHRESRFKNPKISGSRRIEVENWRNESFQEVEDWRS
jgi:hypothetical protein